MWDELRAGGADPAVGRELTEERDRALRTAAQQAEEIRALKGLLGKARAPVDAAAQTDGDPLLRRIADGDSVLTLLGQEVPVDQALTPEEREVEAANLHNLAERVLALRTQAVRTCVERDELLRREACPEEADELKDHELRLQVQLSRWAVEEHDMLTEMSAVRRRLG